MNPQARDRIDAFNRATWRVVHEMKHQGASLDQIKAELMERKVAFLNHSAGPLLRDGKLVHFLARAEVRMAMRRFLPCDGDNCSPYIFPGDK